MAMMVSIIGRIRKNFDEKTSILISTTIFAPHINYVSNIFNLVMWVA